MPQIIQYCLFDPPEVTELPRMDAAVGDCKQNMFLQKFFGGAMKFNTTETNKLKRLDDERA